MASLRDRIWIMYHQYVPRLATSSHVDGLLTKYAGHEHELLDLLVEKYGPEPTMQGGDYPHFLYPSYHQEPSHYSTIVTSPHHPTMVADDVADQEHLIQELLGERARLRDHLDEQFTTQRREFTAAIGRSTASKVALSRIQACVPPGMCPIAEAEDIKRGISDTTNELAGLIALRRALEETVALHLQLYPSSKLRAVLMKEDPGYCLRLENL